MKAIALYSISAFCLFSLVCGKKQAGQSGASDAMQEPVVVEARLSSLTDSLVRVEFVLKMKKNIHIFSGRSRQFEIKTVETTGLGAPSLVLPRPKRIRAADGAPADAYSGVVKILLTCRVTSFPWNMRGYVQFQACDDTQCFFPAKKWFSFSSAGPDSAVKALSNAGKKNMRSSVLTDLFY